jgi:cytoskeletal protein RodZ
MDTPGKILKAEREKQEKSLKEISVNLKLSIDYLTAIEEDNYSELPAEVFAKAYLRLYADELGLDGDYLLGLYYDFGKDDVNDKAVLPEKRAKHSPSILIKYAFNAVSASVMKIKSSMEIVPDFLKKLKASFNFDPESLKKLKPSVRMDVSFIKRALPLMPTGKSLLVAVTVIVVALVVIMISHSDKPVPDEAVTADKQLISGKSSKGDKKELKPVEEAKVHSDKKKERVEEKISGKLVLKIIAEELTWASVSIDGGEHKESLLRAGEAVTIIAEDKFNIKIGNAGGTRLILNGREIGKLGPHGKVVNIELP